MSSPESRPGLGAFAGRLVVRTVGDYAGGGPMAAGAIAFRVLFSVFPLAIVLTAAFGVVVRTTGVQADVIDTVVDNVPLTEDGRQSVRSLLEGVTGGASTIGLVAILFLVWSASGMMAAIRGALNHAWGVDVTRPFLQGKLVDVTLVFGVGVLILASLGLTVGTRMTTAYASSALERVGIPSATLTWLVGFLLPAVLVFVAVAILYRVVPATPTRPELRAILPSAAFVGLMFAVLQSLFGVYLQYFSNYNAVYGSLGAAIAFLLFVYLSATLFLLGANAAAATPRVRAELDHERGRPPSTDDAPFRQKVTGFLRGLVVHTDERPTGDRARTEDE